MLSIATPDSHGNFLLNTLKVNNEDTTITQFDVILVPALLTLNNIFSEQQNSSEHSVHQI